VPEWHAEEREKLNERIDALWATARETMRVTH
jgi:hypothetical protein